MKATTPGHPKLAIIHGDIKYTHTHLHKEIQPERLTTSEMEIIIQPKKKDYNRINQNEKLEDITEMKMD